MATRIETEFRTAAGGHYAVTSQRVRGVTTTTLALMEDTEANEFDLPTDGKPKVLEFVYGMPGVGQQQFLAQDDSNPEQPILHRSTEVVWMPTEDEE